MISPRLINLFSLPLLAMGSAQASVEDWFFDKAITYRQTADDTQPSTASFWFVEIGVATTTPGDFSAASISRVGSATVHNLTFGDGEWLFEKSYASEAALNSEFPSNNDYTFTLTAGSLAGQTQTFTLGAANYPAIPYLQFHNFSLAQSINASQNFSLNWNDPGGFATSASLEVEDQINETCIVDEELDGTPIPTDLLIPGGSFSAGYSYDAYLSFFNTANASGAGGFGTTGYIGHSSNLSFDLQTILSRTPDSIVGAWQFGNGAENGSGVVVFQANGVYFVAEDDLDDGGASDGIETGTYTWDSGTGAFVATVTTDTNGENGLSHPDGSDIITVNGDTLTITDNSGKKDSIQRVGFNSSSLIEGGWYLCDNNGAATGILVFLDNGIYFHAELNDGDPSGADGIERGTYSWDNVSGGLTATAILDTNGELGLSNPIGSFEAILAGPRVMTITDGDPAFLHRVTNAAVNPDWRLNKARGLTQTADNAAPPTVDFWDIWTLVTTRNSSDAGQITLSGGNFPSPVSLTQEDPGIWTYEDEFASQALLDAAVPDGQIYTISISGGELGTVSQTISTGTIAYPPIPFLTGTNFTDAQAIDPTADFDFDWNPPSGSTVQLIVSSLPDEDGTIFYDELIFGGTAEGTTLPALSMPAGQTGYGYLEFSTVSTTSTGLDGFGVSGFSGRQSITFDFSVDTQSGEDLVDSAAAAAGLTGPDTAPTAMPFSDGVENMLKYAFNMNLSGPDFSSLTPGSGNSGLPVFDFDESGPSAEFKVEFVRRKGSGLVYTAKRSFTLYAPFTPMSGAVTVTTIDDQFERVTVSEPCDPATTPRCFGFVEVTAP